MSAKAKAGYTQPEVGVVPDDWRIVQLGNHVRITSGASPSLFEFCSDGTPYFKVEQLGNTDKYLYSESTPYHFQSGPIIQQDSIVFAKRGAAIALNKIRILGEDSFMDTNLMALTPQKELNSEYLFYALSYLGLWRFADITSIPQINNKHIKPILFPLPDEVEQIRITSTLSDMDALISSLDQLIAKKRDIHQATMQQLLAGQRRLPGFSGEWKVMRLGDCLLTNPDYGINAAAVAYSDTLPTYIRITDINDDGYFSPMPRVSVDAPMSSDYLLEEGDVVFARTGASVGKSYRYRADDGPLVFAGFLIRVRPNQRKLIPAFLAAIITTRSYWNWVRLMSMRSGQPGINANEYASLPLRLPGTEEQSAIATVLSDMGAELATVEARRDKARLLKQGMMQKLLTGRIRLI